MKVAILAGGLGTRISEETGSRPKPMIEVGGRPLLWHIMNLYSHHNFQDFVVCAGYMSHVIKDFFVNYRLMTSDIECDLESGAVRYVQTKTNPWKVAVVDTGPASMTGGRIKRVAERLRDGTFMLTYGDGVADIDISALLAHHRKHGRLATVTAVRAPGRFGVLEVDDGGEVSAFREKPEDEVGWINGGFFVLEPQVLDYIDDDATIWEQEPLRRLARENQLSAYRHRGFWQPVDTLRDKVQLENLWQAGTAPWKVWT
jgi:glucose-1-phosphate cytidylyltransferase